MSHSQFQFVIEATETLPYEATLDTNSQNEEPVFSFLPERHLTTEHIQNPATSLPIDNAHLTTVHTGQQCWHPSPALIKTITRLHNEHFYQFPCIPCVQCGRLLYPERVSWVKRNPMTTYQLTVKYPSIHIPVHPNDTEKDPVNQRIAHCSLCKTNTNKRLEFPDLSPIPPEIVAVPYHKRKLLSPIYLQSSLGRSVGSNPFVEYRSIVGTMNLSRNIRCLTLYSGILGAFLTNVDINSPSHAWYHPTLQPAANWLRTNNPYIAAYGSVLEDYVQANNFNLTTLCWPIAQHDSNDQNAPPVIQGDIVVPNHDFPDEIHGENAHYMRLASGFLRTNNNNRLPISFGDSHLEALLFPDLFPNGKGHFKDCYDHRTGRRADTQETYGKYIKHRLQSLDYRFRVHPLWPTWSYLQLEKLRNYQNTQRLLRIHNIEQTLQPRTAAELLTSSLYDGAPIINEESTDPLPTFIRTGDSYFRSKQHHLDTMIDSFGLPKLFITMTMAEGSWHHLKEILAITDNKNTLPTNRPFHSMQHFVHRLRTLKSEIWKKPALAEWGSIENFFERVEFQNRGAAHTHGCYWTDKAISEMILHQIVRSDMPDPINEPDLHAAVLRHQRHTCKPSLCGGPLPNNQRCKKGFPRPFSPTTYEDPQSHIYVYMCNKEEDQWIVPYHAPTLLAWQAHHNVQYVSSRGFARYMVKYISKPEPSHVFNIHEGDRFYNHVVARRLGMMEVMFLTLEENICSSSAQVMYLTSEPPTTRPRSIKPVQLLLADNEHPFWDDAIAKYFARPNSPQFNTLLYEEYHKLYRIESSRPHSNSQFTTDNLGNYVIPRTKPILTRMRRTHINNGEPYFYQLLLRTNPWRSEDELLGSKSTYREHYLSLYPDETEAMKNETSAYLAHREAELLSSFDELLDRFFTLLSSNVNLTIQQLLKIQLTALQKLPPILPQSTAANLPPDQYTALNILTNRMGSPHQHKYPYFFLTGPAGTGKSYIIHLLRSHFQRTNTKYLIVAPTGVAAQNVNAYTIHSAFRIKQDAGQFMTLAFHDQNLRQKLLDLQVLIIDEVSMVSGELLTYLSSIFEIIKGNNTAFGGISVVVVGDLAQLPPVSGTQVFKSSVWSVFHPLFLKESRRQSSDPTFYKLLNEVRTGQISDESWQTLYNRYLETTQHNSPDNILTTTHIVGLRRCAESLNITICNSLPVLENQYILSVAHDVYRNEVWPEGTAEHLFKTRTNLPQMVRLQPGARVMLLNNNHFDIGLCNGSIGFVTEVDPNKPSASVAFQVVQNNKSSIIHMVFERQTASFLVDGAPASRTQFPLQNCFALTVHKSQSLTLPSIDLSLNKHFFAYGHAYVGISRATTWSDVRISELDPAAFKVDSEVLTEYNRLEALSNISLPF